jgi:hypothetical protein
VPSCLPFFLFPSAQLSTFLPFSKVPSCLPFFLFPRCPVVYLSSSCQVELVSVHSDHLGRFEAHLTSAVLRNAPLNRGRFQNK